MRVLGFGTYDAARHPRVAILLDGLRRSGDEIVEVNHPLGFSTAERVAMMQHPATAWRLALRLAARWTRLVARGPRAVRRFDPDVVIVGYLGHFDVVLARVLFPRRRIVLDQLVFAGDTAADRGERSNSLKVRALSGLDRLAVRCADVVLVDTDEHLELVPVARRVDALVVPVGAPDYWFRAPEPDPHPGLRVIFFGLYTPLQGAPIIGAALARLADRTDIEITMIGSGQDLEETRRRAAPNPRVTWLDWVEPTRIPGVVAGFDVCLGIFGVGPKALRVVPNKVFQGAAAGCALVTSDTAPQRRLLGDAATFVPPGDADALAGALRTLADDPAAVAALRRRAYQRAIGSFSPEAVAAQLRPALIRPR